ncbi:HD domain-containing protein [Paractinoplanes durhamensis]|uniref:HD-CE domain-containing protein n=1 Tax=Paractinoplanes durhamensis TaxID=113563 RepID=A0ABQ3YYT2_9ACTN|nr:ATP-binding protein [Actinoplanes durhamensis]GIE02722.1 hypothetical protein Adu01nite_40720 [Actinoplanes durhamensis]
MSSFERAAADRDRLVRHLQAVRRDSSRSYRELATRLQLSASSKGRVSDILNGSALPSNAGQARQLVLAMGGSPEDAEKAAKLAEAAIRSAKETRRRTVTVSRPSESVEVVYQPATALFQPAGPVLASRPTAAGESPRTPGPGSQASIAEIVEGFPDGADILAAARRGGVDPEHAERLLTLVTDLLGPALAQIGGADAALLLLAAHHHRPAGTEADSLRPQVFRPTWQGVPLRGAVVALCESLTRPAHDLRGARFDPVLGLDADLRFCAVILRIAEFMDMSDARHPAEVRRHLGLSVDGLKAWNGQLHMGRWVFPVQRTPGYTVSRLAAPTHPAAEHDLRRYLADVEGELLQCLALQHQFQRTAQDIELPGKISLDHLTSDGYKYGEFRFELDRSAMLELFTGEQLYDDQYVFIRELLQNAFDATRLRRLFDGEDTTDAVVVSCWPDEIGYLWIRVDDQGIGMDEHALVDYFLRVGKSYYRSATLRAELTRQGIAESAFTPISRFGIGVLSCFLVADRVEVSTRRRYADGTEATALRLSLRRDEDFFVLRENPDPVDPMPARDYTGETYRTLPGTSLALRVDPLRAHLTTDTVETALDRYLFCPPVPVTFNDVEVGTVTNDLVDRPWFPEPQIVDVPAGPRFEVAGSMPYAGPLKIAILPLDLTAHSPTPQLRGQLLVCRVLTNADPDSTPRLRQALRDPFAGCKLVGDHDGLREARAALRNSVVSWSATCEWRTEYGLEFRLNRRLDVTAVRQAVVILAKSGPSVFDEAEGPTDDHPPTVDFLLRRILLQYRTHADSTGTAEYSLVSQFRVPWRALPIQPEVLAIVREHGWLGHNGIAVPVKLRDLSVVAWGMVALADSLRPDVSVARDQVRGIPFSVHSALQLAARRATAAWPGTPFSGRAAALERTTLIHVPPHAHFSAAALDDEFVAAGLWDNEEVIETLQGLRSVEAIRAGHAGRAFDLRPLYRYQSWQAEHGSAFVFIDFLRLALAHRRLNLAQLEPRNLPADPERYSGRPYRYGPVVLDGALPLPSPRVDLFPPQTFLPCPDRPHLIRHESGVWNLDHPLIKWIIEHIDELVARAPVAYDQLRRIFADSAGTAPRSIRSVLDNLGRTYPSLVLPDHL